ncbi:hypothetical protein [Pseudomonas monsensis]|uniref:hypothetical protein n=1 Tax=Pseudomonas monsensis TaxID=2745509 RepID=UPI002AB8F160|nr:hypothetical protein [Pseudomonas monsensis]MDZ3828192.1 hypothetical protein [Pseudomonas monsensis]
MNQKRRRVVLHHPPPYRESHLSKCLTILFSVFLTGLGGLLAYLVIEGLVQGSITLINRGGPAMTYTLATQPRLYWFHMVWQGLFALLLLAAGPGWYWITRLSRPAAPAKRKVKTH